MKGARLCRLTKGLVEMLMLRRAHVTIYTASKDDTLGKDSELAATLAQGKAVIAYVPPDLDRKAELLRVDHPLGLQIDIKTGVAHGIIVVRSPEQCAQMLRKVLLREQTAAGARASDRDQPNPSNLFR